MKIKLDYANGLDPGQGLSYLSFDLRSNLFATQASLFKKIKCLQTSEQQMTKKEADKILTVGLRLHLKTEFLFLPHPALSVKLPFFSATLQFPAPEIYIGSVMARRHFNCEDLDLPLCERHNIWSRSKLSGAIEDMTHYILL